MFIHKLFVASWVISGLLYTFASMAPETSVQAHRRVVMTDAAAQSIREANARILTAKLN
ncbi:MAG: hypothetical protein ACAI44_10065 [Candidatus Sericytochromatia bacterium]